MKASIDTGSEYSIVWVPSVICNFCLPGQGDVRQILVVM